MEHLGRTIYFNRAPLQVCLSRFDLKKTGRCNRRQFRVALKALSRALSEKDEPPKIPDEQVEYLISGLKWKKGRLNYEKFLNSFEVIDIMEDKIFDANATSPKAREFRSETQMGAQILKATMRLGNFRTNTPSSIGASSPEMSPVSYAGSSLKSPDSAPSPNPFIPLSHQQRQHVESIHIVGQVDENKNRSTMQTIDATQVLVMNEDGHVHLRDFATTSDGNVRVRRSSMAVGRQAENVGPDGLPPREHFSANSFEVLQVGSPVTKPGSPNVLNIPEKALD